MKHLKPIHKQTFKSVDKQGMIQTDEGNQEGEETQKEDQTVSKTNHRIN